VTPIFLKYEELTLYFLDASSVLEIVLWFLGNLGASDPERCFSIDLARYTIGGWAFGLRQGSTGRGKLSLAIHYSLSYWVHY